MWHTLDFKRLVELLLPTFLRKSKTLAFLKATIAPLETLRDSTLYKMQHTCQVIYLEKMLNEWFNVPNYDHQNHEATKAITIIDEFHEPENYVFLEGENEPSLEYDNVNKWLDADAIFAFGEVAYYDFVVQIPSTYSFVLEQLRATIEYYKLAGKKYRIQII